MQLSRLLLAATTVAVASAELPITVPTPWNITDLSLSNQLHGLLGFWKLRAGDPTPGPQGFNTICSYQSNRSSFFALDDAPLDEPCEDSSVRFGFWGNGTVFTLNITHRYPCDYRSCNDNATWTFTYDTVRGQEDDALNNFGQFGSFLSLPFFMYPKRALPSETAPFGP